MTDDETQENLPVPVKNKSDEISLEERTQKLKKSKWNFFMYLGIGLVLFAFAFIPFTYEIPMEDRFGETHTGYVWGLPIAGEDLTDVSADVTITIKSLPESTNGFEVAIVEAPTCADTTGTLNAKYSDMQSDPENYSNYYVYLEDIAPGQVHEISMSLDPGTYCIKTFVDSNNAIGVDADVEIATYPNQYIAIPLGIICILLSIVSFVIMKKHGKYVAKSELIAAGPSGPPQAAGPSGPPQAAGPTASSEIEGETDEAQNNEEENVEGEIESENSESATEVSEVTETFEDQGNGYFFRKFSDGTYDQSVYVVQNGEYVPYVYPDE